MPRPLAAPTTIPPMAEEGIIGRKLAPGMTPARVVVVRLHAFGDAVITLPVIAGLRRLLPDADISIVTSDEYRELFESASEIDQVHPFPARASKVRRAAAAAILASRIASKAGPPDLLLDLQRSTISLLLGSLMRPTAWAGFDRFAPRAALDRYLDAARWVGMETIEPRYAVALRPGIAERAEALLHEGAGGRVDERPLVALNPAGCWPTKNWPVPSYVALGRRLIEEWRARIVLLGTGNVREGAGQIARELGDDAIDLVGRTTTAEALAIVQRLRLMVSDDSGLMHLAWVSGIPTIGLFGASRATWSAPHGEHSFCFGSEDLECGACMSAVCGRGDLHCLQRVTVDEVFGRCMQVVGGRDE